MAPYNTLDELCNAARECAACALAEGRANVVPGEGNPAADLLFVGEGPGFQEDQKGRPFVGPAGKLLDQLIAAAGLTREEVYITNVVKCRPPGNRDPLPEEVEACRSWLDQQIEMVSPKIIVTLGRHSLARFLPGETSIARVHGMPRRAGNFLIMPMYHPAAALYQQSLRKVLEEDFRKLPSLVRDAQASAASAAAPADEGSDDQPRQLGLF